MFKLTKEKKEKIKNVLLQLSSNGYRMTGEIGLTYCHSFFHRMVAQSFQFYQHQTSSRNSDGVTPCGGTKMTKYRWGINILQFWTNESLYLTNDTR